MNLFYFYIKPILIVIVISLSFYPFGWIAQLLIASNYKSPLLNEGRLNLVLLWLPLYFLLIKQTSSYLFKKQIKSLTELLFPNILLKKSEILYSLRLGLVISLGWVVLSILSGGIQYSIGILSGLWALAAAGILTLAFCDELLFRGIIPIIFSSQNRTQTIITSSALFAISRAIIFPFSLTGTIGAFLLGVALYYLYEKSGSLWAGSLFHGLILIIWGSIFGLPISSNATASIMTPFQFSTLWGDGYGPMASPILWIFLVSIPLSLEIQKKLDIKAINWIANFYFGKPNIK